MSDRLTIFFLLCTFRYSTYYKLPYFIHHKMTTRSSKRNQMPQPPPTTFIENDDLFAPTVELTTDYVTSSTTELVSKFKDRGSNLSPAASFPTILIHIHLKLYSLITISLFNSA